MKVFISWSGEPSRAIARELCQWLPLVVQHVRPWLSDEEIASGTRWNDRVAKALNESDFGIVCVTRANQHQPWLMFEAGALAKRLETAAVVPICVDIAPAEVTGPLEAFQGRRLDEDGMRRLIHDVSKTRDEPLPADRVNKLFDRMWPDLKAAVHGVRKTAQSSTAPLRDQRDMIEELVDRVRRIERNSGPAGRWFELFPDGRHIFYEGDEPEKFARQVQLEFGFDVTKDAKWGAEHPDFMQGECLRTCPDQGWTHQHFALFTDMLRPRVPQACPSADDPQALDALDP